MRPLTPEEQNKISEWIAARRAMSDDDPRMSGMQADANFFEVMLKEQAQQYEQRERVLWRAIYVLSAVVGILVWVIVT